LLGWVELDSNVIWGWLTILDFGRGSFEAVLVPGVLLYPRIFSRNLIQSWFTRGLLTICGLEFDRCTQQNPGNMEPPALLVCPFHNVDGFPLNFMKQRTMVEKWLRLTKIAPIC